jgi:hypothetical protein
MNEGAPETLSTVTSLPAGKHEPWNRRNRRPRPIIRGPRANTLPVIKPGEKIFRVNPDPPGECPRCGVRIDAPGHGVDCPYTVKVLDRHRQAGRVAIREWGLRNGYEVRARGKIPADVQAAFMTANDIWTVRVVSALLPGAKDFSRHFHVRQGEYTISRTVDPDAVRRELGPELYNLLWEV